MSHSHLLLILLCLLPFYLSEDCSNFNGEYGCTSGQHEYPTSWDSRSFQTPPRDTQYYRSTYQDMNLLVGYVQIKYSADRKQATLTFIFSANPLHMGQQRRILIQHDHPHIIRQLPRWHERLRAYSRQRRH